jgi:hypothetical protein
MGIIFNNINKKINICQVLHCFDYFNFIKITHFRMGKNLSLISEYNYYKGNT